MQLHWLKPLNADCSVFWLRMEPHGQSCSAAPECLLAQCRCASVGLPTSLQGCTAVLLQRKAWNCLHATFVLLGWIHDELKQTSAPTCKQLLHFDLPSYQDWEWFIKDLPQDCKPQSPDLPRLGRNWRHHGISCMFRAWQDLQPVLPMCETCGDPCKPSESDDAILLCSRCEQPLCPECKVREDGNCGQCQ